MIVDRSELEKHSNSGWHDPMPEEPANSEAAGFLDHSNEPVVNAEDACRIVDLERQVKSLKQQVLTALDKAEKSIALEKKVKSLEEQVAMLLSKILEGGSNYMIGILVSFTEPPSL
jgi:hypothetical protein